MIVQLEYFWKDVQNNSNAWIPDSAQTPKMVAAIFWGIGVQDLLAIAVYWETLQGLDK